MHRQIKKRHWEAELPDLEPTPEITPGQHRVDFAYPEGEVETYWDVDSRVWKLVAISLPK